VTSIGTGFYEKQLARKQSELAAIELDLETAQGKLQEQKLMKQAEQLLDEINKIELKLSYVNLRSDEPKVRVISLDDTFRKIDFDLAKQIARNLHANFPDDLGASILFLQKTTKHMGQYCLDEMLSIIFERDIQISRSNGQGNCKVYTAGLSDVTAEATELVFLQKLSEYHGSGTSVDPFTLNQAFRESFCRSLRSGDRVLILVKDCHLLVDPQSFLNWFVDRFWKPLIEEIQDSVISEYGFIRIVAILTCTSQIDDCHLTTIPFCTIENFNPYHMIDIPLSNWTVNDIQRWLMNVRQLGRNDSETKAKQIHAESEGIPHLICSILKETYST
jgi:hypothetical protein